MFAHQYIPKVFKKSQKRYQSSADHTPQRVLRQFENDCSVSPTAARSEGGRCVGQIPLNPPLSTCDVNWGKPVLSLVEGREAQGDFCARSRGDACVAPTETPPVLRCCASLKWNAAPAVRAKKIRKWGCPIHQFWRRQTVSHLASEGRNPLSFRTTQRERPPDEHLFSAACLHKE